MALRRSSPNGHVVCTSNTTCRRVLLACGSSVLSHAIAVARKVAGVNFCAAKGQQRDTVLSPLLSHCLIFTQASQRHHHRQYHHVILSEHLHRRCTFAPRHGFRSIPSETLSTQAQAPHTTSSTYTERLWPPQEWRKQTTRFQRQQRCPGRKRHKSDHDNRDRSRI